MPTDPHELVGDMLAHTVYGVDMLLRDAPDWDHVESYGGRLYAARQYLGHAQEQFRLAREVRPAK
jgi:hypothetical protein